MIYKETEPYALDKNLVRANWVATRGRGLAESGDHNIPALDGIQENVGRKREG